MSPMSAISGVGGLVSGLLPGGPTTTNQNQTTSGTTNQNTDFTSLLNSLINTLQNTTQQNNTSGAQQGTSSTAANLGPQQQQLLNQLTQKYSALTAPSLSGYAAQQTQGINKNSDIQSQAVNNIMASRGLATSPVSGTAQAGIEQGRVGQINQMQAGLPVLQNQLNTQNLGAASSFLQSTPGLLGTTATNQGSTVGQQSQAGQTTGQTIQGQTSTGTQATTGTNNSTTAGTSSTQQQGSAAGGIAGLLAGLFSDIRLKEEVKPIAKAVDKLMALRPSTWKWKGTQFEDQGVLAQDVARVLPELIDEEKGFLKVNYAGLIGTLVSAVQEMEAR